MKKIVSIPPIYLFSSLIFIILTYFFMPDFNLIIFPFNLSGLLFLLTGLFLILSSEKMFADAKTPHNYGKSKVFVKKGLYKFSRNPMYLGMVLLLSGTSIITGNLFSLSFPVIFFLIIHFMFIPYEEEKMEKTFKKDYLKYKKDVRRWL